jgi:hypothetical protein
MISDQEQQKRLAQVVARAWEDDEYKRRLIHSPAATLRDAGIELEEGVDYRMHESTATLRYLVLPPKPSIPVTEKDIIDSLTTPLELFQTVRIVGRPKPPGRPRPRERGTGGQ